MTALRLYLVRHGEPDAEDLLYGHSDVPLSPRGERQAAAAARALGHLPLAAVLSSDLRRAARGAELIARGRELAPVLSPALREMHLGALERLTFSDARASLPELVGRRYEDMLDFRMPGGGESVRDVAERVLPCVHQAILRFARAPLRGRQSDPPALALVAHNTVNRVLLACAAGLGPEGYTRFEQAFGAISRIDLRDDWSEGDPWAAARIGLANWSPPE